MTGIGRYCWELATRLPHHPDIGSIAYYRNWLRIGEPAHLTVSPNRAVRTARILRERMARALPNPSADVVHGPNYRLPDWAERGVVTIHDLSVLRFPETHPAQRVRDFAVNFDATIARASHLITDSESVREEVIAYTGFPRNLVTAVGLGVAPHFRPRPPIELAAFRERHRLPPQYGLTVSSLEPRKRVDRLLLAWRDLPTGVRARFPLVIAGARGWRNDALRTAIDEAAREGWVIPLGFVTEDELPLLYAGASLFAYPSLYEGFGLPPLEAMASGVPTIVADERCLAEVTNGAAMFVNPEDVSAFSDALLKGLADQQWRQRAISAGIRVSARFTWDRCVVETVAVYQQVMAA